MKLKMGALADQKRFNHRDGQKDRDRVIEDLNTGNLDRIIITDRVGGSGHNLVGTNHMISWGHCILKLTRTNVLVIGSF